MRDVDRGRVDAVVQFAQLAAHQFAELGIERAQRLVHQERLRPPHHRAAQRHALAVAAGQISTSCSSSRCSMRSSRAVSTTRSRISRARHALALERKADVLRDIHMRIEREQLEHEGDVARARRAGR